MLEPHFNKIFNYIEKRFQHKCFAVNSANFLRTAFSSGGCFDVHSNDLIINFFMTGVPNI